MAIDSNNLDKLFGITDYTNSPLDNSNVIDLPTVKENVDPSLPVESNEDDLSPMEESDDNELIEQNNIFEENTLINPETIDNSLNNSIELSLNAQSNLVKQAQKLVDLAIDNASAGNSRDIETAAESINSASEVIDKLLNLQERIQKLKNTSSNLDNPTFIQNQNIVFSGTTSDAIKQIKNMNKNKENN